MNVKNIIAASAVLVLSSAGLLADLPSAAAAGSQTLVASADAGVYSGAPATNYGTSTTARLDHSAGADRPWYVRFPAPTVPAGEHVTSAHLRFFNLALAAGYTKPPAVVVNDITSTWSETGITYGNRPAAGQAIRGAASAGQIGGYTDVTLSGYVGGVVSLLVQATDSGSAHVYAREDTSGHPPVLVVTTAKNAVQPDLSPAQGAWLGWYQSGNADPTKVEGAYGRKTDAFRRYYSLGKDQAPWPTATDVAIAKADGNRRTLFATVSNRCYGSCPTSINGKALPAPLVVSSGNPDFDGPYFTPAQISSGALDPLIDAQAASIKAAGIPIVLDLMHEVDTTTEKMDDTTVRPEYGGMTLHDWWETTFPAAYRHWEDRLKSQGVTNVRFAIDYAGFRSDTTAYTRTYPGDAYVDWIAWDPYDFTCTKGGTQRTWNSFYTKLEAGLLGDGAKAKSYGIFETAVGGGSATSSCRVTWVNGMAEAATSLTKIKAIIYFDRASADYNLEDDPAVLSAWKAEIKSPYLNQPHQ